jgi:pyroglutamyl-peptidase
MPNTNCAILITGFGPFPGVPHNVSAAIADAVGHEARRCFPSSHVVTATLPTQWDIAPERAADLICDLQPSLALHFGVSSQARGFVIETIARNEADRVDAAGTLPVVPTLEPFGPDQLPTQLHAGRIKARLDRLGLPARLSRDAGTYLCNAVFYRSVLTQRELGGHGRSGFIHIPTGIKSPRPGFGPTIRATPACDLDFERAKRGAIEIIAACLNRF